jgi:hypothetical protein
MALHPLPLAAVLSLSLLAAAGCGGTGSNEPAGADTGDETSRVDNCSLVTDAEAASLAGYELTHGEDSALGCGYARPGSMMSHFTVRVIAGKGAAKDNFGDHSADTTIHEISGVGDSAAALARDQHVNFLIVQKGRRYIQFVTTFLDDVTLGSPKLKEAQDLALKAIDRIK